MTTHRLFGLREREFIESCRAVILTADRDGIDSLNSLAAKVVHCPAPRYYVDIDYAYRMLLKIRKSGQWPRRAENRRMWQEILAKTEQAMERDRSLSLMQAVTQVLVDDGASSYFLDHKTAVRKLQRYNRTHKATRFFFAPR